MTIDFTTFIEVIGALGSVVVVYVRLSNKIESVENATTENTNYRLKSEPDKNRSLETLVEIGVKMDTFNHTLIEIKTDIHQIKNDIDNVYASNPELNKPLK